MKKAITILVVALLMAISAYAEEKKEIKAGAETANNAAASEELAGKTVYIKSGSLNVRSEASGKSSKLGMISKGQAVEVKEEKTDETGEKWLKVTFAANKDGWIKAQFIATDRNSMLSPELRNLDFAPVAKAKEYPGNPKIKVRGVYLTLYSASGKRLETLIQMTKRTNINAFVIDVKDDNGNMLFYSKSAEKFSPKANKAAPIKDIAAYVKKLKDNNIYTIARIVSFKDPNYTETHPERAIINKNTGIPYTNADKLKWATPYDRQLWEYNVGVAKEAALAGFNEIQFDYVRFPASNGGKLDAILDYRNVKGESKPQAIQEYLKYARKEISPLKAYISADIYGLVGSVADDMALGQYWEAVSNVVDYVSPMMYPSHYANATYGLSIPDAFPYETVYNSTKDAVARNKNIKTPAIIRPWIQDFTAAWVKGHIKYSSSQVAAQIKAMKENGVEEFLLWNAGNKYSESAVAK